MVVKLRDDNNVVVQKCFYLDNEDFVVELIDKIIYLKSLSAKVGGYFFTICIFFS
jgi:hypothetical protein